MANILAHIHVDKSRLAEFENVIRELYQKTWEREPGCVKYEFWRGAEEAKYYCLMCFVDYDAFLEHQVSDHHQAIIEFAKSFRKVDLEWIDPVPDASDLGRTREQKLPPDINKAKKRYTLSHPLQVQAWWDKVVSG